MNWSKDFFNNISKNFFMKSTVEPDIIDFFKSLGVSHSTQVVEQCCGEGQLQIALAKHLGCKTFGLDQCSEYIKTAKMLAKEAQVTSTFMEYDILNGKCVGLSHFVVNWGTSWGYFEDDSLNLKFLQNAYINLRKNGTFVLEYYNSDFVINNFEPLKVTKKEIDGNHYSCKRISHIERNFLISNCIITDDNDNEIFNSTGLTKMYSQQDILSMLATAGFKDIVCYADFNKSAASSNHPRLIFVSKK